MRRFTFGFLILFCSLNLKASEQSEKRVYVIPASKITPSSKYTGEQIQKMFTDYANSFDGKNVWSGIALEDKTNITQGLAIPTSAEGTAKHDYAASCYRCALGRGDIVKREHCLTHGFKWELATLKDVKSSCN